MDNDADDRKQNPLDALSTLSFEVELEPDNSSGAAGERGQRSGNEVLGYIAGGRAWGVPMNHTMAQGTLQLHSMSGSGDGKISAAHAPHLNVLLQAYDVLVRPLCLQWTKPEAHPLGQGEALQAFRGAVRQLRGALEKHAYAGLGGLPTGTARHQLTIDASTRPEDIDAHLEQRRQEGFVSLSKRHHRTLHDWQQACVGVAQSARHAIKQLDRAAYEDNAGKAFKLAGKVARDVGAIAITAEQRPAATGTDCARLCELAKAMVTAALPLRAADAGAGHAAAAGRILHLEMQGQELLAHLRAGEPWRLEARGADAAPVLVRYGAEGAETIMPDPVALQLLRCCRGQPRGDSSVAYSNRLQDEHFVALAEHMIALQPEAALAAESGPTAGPG